jgi:hypothetical protein
MFYLRGLPGRHRLLGRRRHLLPVRVEWIAEGVAEHFDSPIRWCSQERRQPEELGVRMLPDKRTVKPKLGKKTEGIAETATVGGPADVNFH